MSRKPASEQDVRVAPPVDGDPEDTVSTGDPNPKGIALRSAHAPAGSVSDDGRTLRLVAPYPTVLSVVVYEALDAEHPVSLEVLSFELACDASYASIVVPATNPENGHDWRGAHGGSLAPGSESAVVSVQQLDPPVLGEGNPRIELDLQLRLHKQEDMTLRVNTKVGKADSSNVKGATSNTALKILFQ